MILSDDAVIVRLQNTIFSAHDASLGFSFAAEITVEAIRNGKLRQEEDVGVSGLTAVVILVGIRFQAARHLSLCLGAEVPFIPWASQQLSSRRYIYVNVSSEIV